MSTKKRRPGDSRPPLGKTQTERSQHRPSTPSRQTKRRKTVIDASEKRDTSERAREMWDSADRELYNTPVEKYLYTIDDAGPPWPSSLRYIRDCWHSPTGKTYPALVAAITDYNGSVTGIQRTFLNDDGTIIEYQPRRMMLGCCAGNAVHFGIPRPGEWLLVTERLESAVHYHYSTHFSCWAALSAPGLKRIEIPAEVEAVLFVPTSPKGATAAADTAARLIDEGRLVEIAGASL